jgi:hypothetical protein
MKKAGAIAIQKKSIWQNYIISVKDVPREKLLKVISMNGKKRWLSVTGTEEVDHQDSFSAIVQKAVRDHLNSLISSSLPLVFASVKALSPSGV